MSRKCSICDKGPQYGNRVSHAHNQTRHRWLPNLQRKRFWVPSENRWVTLTVSAKGNKTINRKGIEPVLAEMRARGEKV